MTTVKAEYNLVHKPNPLDLPVAPDPVRRQVVYVAGPYRAPFEYQVAENILLARQHAAEIWRMGGIALCPHLNTAMLGGVAEDEQFLEGCLELMLRCDAVLMVGDWAASSGSMAERDLAIAQRMPVFYDLEEVRNFYCTF